jgi:hypothetical protein
MSKQPVRSYIWDELESLPRPELEKLQVERLRAGIDRVSQTVPFYKSKLSEANVTADSIRSLEDLDRLPFTTAWAPSHQGRHRSRTGHITPAALYRARPGKVDDALR